jgi:class 3 adenylate cyclase
MDTAGDSVYAVFDDPAAALVFGRSVLDEVHRLGLRLRVGVHTGGCWWVDRKCAGLDVSIGARIASEAAPDELLVSDAVRRGLAGDDRFAFHLCREAELKGVPGRWPLYSVLGTTA